MKLLRILLFVALATLAIVGCGKNPDTTDGGVDGGIGDCFDDTDCPDPNLFFCNTTTSKCEPSCHNNDQCSAAGRGSYPIDYCAGGLGCVCDEGKCVSQLCSSDSDCGTQVCRDGACVAPPSATDVSSCQVTPAFALVRAGATVKFTAAAFKANDPVVIKDGATWTTLNSAGTVPSGAKGATVVFTAASSAVGPVDGVQATFGTTTCKAKVVVLPATVATGKLDVVVIDELSGWPVSGATVMASNPTAGTTVGTTQTTLANGWAELTIPGGNNVVNVSVFHNDFSYLTVTNYDITGTGADARFLAMVVRRNQVESYGGFKGSVQNVPPTANVHAGLAGMSLAGSIVDLSVTQLLGPSVPTHVKIGSALDKDNVPLPAGVYLGFSGDTIKPTVSGQGLAGVCFTGGAPDETAIKNGTCGTRSMWSLLGDVPISELPIDKFAGGFNNIDYSGVLKAVIPIFRHFNSSVRRDVSFTLKDTPIDGGHWDFSNTSHFTQANPDFKSVALGFNFVVKSPDLPQFCGKDPCSGTGNYVDGLAILGGAAMAGRGVVPLGLGVAVNTSPADNKTDVQVELPSQGLISMRMAPTHSGLEGSEYGLVALTMSLKSANDVNAGVAGSAIYARIPNNHLSFDPKGTAGVINIPGSYPKYPVSAKYNYADVASGALSARTFKMSPDPQLDATLVRVVFRNANERQWVVWLDPAKASTGFALPKPPGSFSDRTFMYGTNSSRSLMMVQSVRLEVNAVSPTGTPMTYTKMLEFNSTNADRMAEMTTGFSFIDYARPDAWFISPAYGATVTAGSAVKVQVVGFRVGTGSTDDGQVKLSFTGGTGCGTPVYATSDASGGKGEISINLPAGCTGTNVDVSAELVDKSTASLNPAVKATTRLTIN